MAKSRENGASKGKTANGSFRRARPRASRACEVCHARKVRCDVMQQKPCTNCVAFGCECKVPEGKSRRGASVKQDPDEAEEEPRRGPSLDEEEIEHKFPKPPDQERTIFMGSASNVPLFTGDFFENRTGYEKMIVDGWSTPDQLSREDIAVLKIKGAFFLPPRSVCNDLIDAYFEKIHPLLPVINKTVFLKRYHDPTDQPPLLLLQAVFGAAAHVCKNPALKDEDGTPGHARALFYKRAKALFDSDYERDRSVSLVGALILSLSVDSPDKVNNNIFYWTRIAVTLAQSIGMHRWLPNRNASIYQKRMFKRIWWSLFVRDRSTATAYGRPMMINLEDTDVPMISPDDFLEEQEDGKSVYSLNQEQMDYFIHAVKLHEIMGMVLRQQYSVGAERLRLQNQLPDVSQCDIALATWVNNLPQNLRYSIRNVEEHSYFKALLYLQYYTVLCLAHRPHVVLFSAQEDAPYPSWGIAFQAAHMIVKILENLRHFDEVASLPAICVYTSFTALIMLVYQLESADSNVRQIAEKALASLMVDIRGLGTVYETAHQIVEVAARLSGGDGKRRPLRLVKRPRREDSETNLHRTKVRPGDAAAAPKPSLTGTKPSDAITVGGPVTEQASKQTRNDQNPPSGLSPELFMVTQSPSRGQSFATFEPQLLFPQSTEEENGDDLLAPLLEAEKGMTALSQDGSASSSSDEMLAPDSLAMLEWYDYLIANNNDQPTV